MDGTAYALLSGWDTPMLGIVAVTVRGCCSGSCDHVEPELLGRNGGDVFHHCLTEFNKIFGCQRQHYGQRFPPEHDQGFRWRLQHLSSLKFDINHKNRRGHTALQECALDTHYKKLISDGQSHKACNVGRC
jgi:hypothetical protein